MSGIRETVMKRMVRLDKLFAEKKFDEAVTFYTDDFAGLYPGQAIIKDKKVYKSFLEKCYAAAGKYHQEIVDFRQLGEDNVFAIGIVKYFDGDGKVIQQLKVITLLKKIDGEWYVHADAANSDSATDNNSVFDHKKLDA